MSHKDGTMIYHLDRSLEYSKNGEFVKAEFIEFYEFGGAHTRQYMKLRQYVDKAIFDAQKLVPENGDAEEDNTITRPKPLHEVSEKEHEESYKGLSELLNVSISLSDDEDRLNNFIKAFKDLVLKSETHPIAKIDGDVIIKDVTWNKIHVEDQISIATRYCAFFGIGLLGQMKEESENVSKRPTEVKEV